MTGIVLSICRLSLSMKISLLVSVHIPFVFYITRYLFPPARRTVRRRLHAAEGGRRRAVRAQRLAAARRHRLARAGPGRHARRERHTHRAVKSANENPAFPAKGKTGFFQPGSSKIAISAKAPASFCMLPPLLACLRRCRCFLLFWYWVLSVAATCLLTASWSMLYILFGRLPALQLHCP